MPDAEADYTIDFDDDDEVLTPPAAAFKPVTAHAATPL